MKSFTIPFLLLLLVIGAKAQAIKNGLVVIGQMDSVQSKILGEKRQIGVYVPPAMYPDQRFPVLYLLDGYTNFEQLVALVFHLGIVNRTCPPMIIVGIDNTDRTRDLTPTHSTFSLSPGPNPGAATSGGGEKFLAYIEKELMPHIDSLYPTTPYKAFIGHSLGGLMVMNALINHPQLFNDYIAIDPSMWWDKQNLLQQVNPAFAQKNYAGKNLFLAMANTMPPGMDTLQARKDSSNTTLHPRSIMALYDLLRSNPRNRLNYDFNYYKNESHGTVPLIAEYDALHFLFRDYALAFAPEQNPDYTTNATKFDVSALITVQFKQLSTRLGCTVLPPEYLVNDMANDFLHHKNEANAYRLFALNIENYPGSFHAYDSMGDYYKFKHDRKKAAEYYAKSLKINESPETRSKIIALGNKN
ncbi:alpha/beta hydrolase [Mucilaginibacter jinjuensis]|uniref:Alpha/beta hydrolase-fold protein n=1 Tax=Mucilaginibacter jinjuensis TaxID=1176721 RepID=A0ABY7TAD8_9SPHI|nr:alpha/beta hydrolase-fold protein [Mucilaginibacter jinjuensis]WCT13301.1 alpha/beta hydrolase-fold protein [Mucilaginibacter jinjuensis]